MQINTTSDALDNLNKKLGGADIEIEPSTNKVDALKKIYKTLGGTDDVKGLSTVYQVLEKITEVAEGGGGSDNIIIINPDNGISITPREAIQALIDSKIIVWNAAAFEETITNSSAYSYFTSQVYYDIDASLWYMKFIDGAEIISDDIDEDFYVD